MIRLITLASALVVAVGAALFVYQTLPEPVPDPTLELHLPAHHGPPPKLEVVGTKSHQFGSMLVGGKGAHTWEFRNTGEGPLDVWLEETSCSCTVATLGAPLGEKATPGKKAEKGKRITIAPGQSSPIEVDWEGRRAGRFAQAATIGTSDPDNPSVVLSILGKVLPPVEVLPSDSIGLPDAPADEPRRTTLEILSHDRPDLKLIKVSTSRPDVIVVEARPMPAEELKRLEVRSGYTLAVEIKPGLPPGRFSEEILIETDHPKQPSIRVVLAGNTVGPITVVPPRVGMPSVASAAGASQDLTVIVRGNRETKIEVASKPEKVRVAISREEKPGARGRYRLNVTVPPGTAPGLVDDPIVLKTDDPRVKELRIPVSIYVSSRSEGG